MNKLVPANESSLLRKRNKEIGLQITGKCCYSSTLTFYLGNFSPPGLSVCQHIYIHGFCWEQMELFGKALHVQTLVRQKTLHH